ncbi:MAG: M20 family metallopeptidase [Mycobacterium sp.]
MKDPAATRFATVREDDFTLSEELIALRRAIHAEPELGLDLPRTQAKILEALRGLPLEITLGTGLTSVTAVLRGDMPGPLVLLRGDMDALPIAEASGEPFSSSNGAMHACGHDLHVAAVVGAARLLCARRDQLAGDVQFVFQPGEEAGGGAAMMIAEGALEAAGRTPDAAYGLHVHSSYIPAGRIASRPGTLMASSDKLTVRVVGVGGHGSQPHLAKDPVHVLCEIVVALQGMVTRQFNVFDPVVITVGCIEGGSRENVIPESARFDATVRTVSTIARAKVEHDATRLCQHIAAAHGVQAEVRYLRDLPPTVNDATEQRFVQDTVTEVFGPKRWFTMPHPQLAAEDFSLFLNAVPGCYMFLGTSVFEDYTQGSDLHAATSRFDDRWLADGAALLTELALRRLACGRIAD